MTIEKLLEDTDRLLEAATPGPLTAELDAHDEDYWSVLKGKWPIAEQLNAGDAALIVHAPTALRQLVDEVRRLRAEIKLATELQVNKSERTDAHVRTRPDMFDRETVDKVRETLINGGGVVTIPAGGMGTADRDASVLADFMLRRYAEAYSTMAENEGWSRQGEISAKSIMELRSRELDEAQSTIAGLKKSDTFHRRRIAADALELERLRAELSEEEE